MVNDVSKVLSVELVKIALKDFEVSRTLFEQKHYPQAIFMLQQSLEKSMKAILLKLGLVRVEELKRKVGHSIVSNALELIVYRSVKTFIILAGNVIRQLDRIREEVPQDQKIHVEEIYNSIKEIIVDMARYSSTALGELLKQREKLSAYVKALKGLAFKELDEKVKSRLDKVMDELTSLSITSILPGDIVEHISRLISSISELTLILPDAEREEILEQCEKYLYSATLSLHLAYTLFMMILWYMFLEPIVSSVRYPSMKKKRKEVVLVSPLSIDEDVVIVEWCKDVIEHIEKNNTLVCLKESIEEKVESPRCREILESLRKYLNIVISTS